MIDIHQGKTRGLHVDSLPDQRCCYSGNYQGIEISEHGEPALLDNQIAVIMAGGIGERLLPYTKSVPKSMMKIQNRPILEYLIRGLRKHGFKRIIMCVNYMANQIIDYFQDGAYYDVSIIYINEEKPLGTIGALRLAETYLGDHFIVLNADLLCNVDYRELIYFHIMKKFEITIVAKPMDVMIPYGVLEFDKEKRIQKISEKPTYTLSINSGIYALSKSVLNRIPNNEYLDATSLFETILQDQKEIGCYEYDGYWIDIGNINDYNRANNEYAAYMTE